MSGGDGTAALRGGDGNGALVALGRLALLLAAFALAWLAARLRRPPRRELEAALVASGVQLWLAVVLDGACVALGLWRYPDPGAAALGAPLDLHLAWALGYGLAFLLLAPREAAAARRAGLVLWAATVTVDGLAAPYLAPVFVPAPGLVWLLADGALVALLLFVAWALRAAILQPAPRPGAAFGRAAIYLLAFGSIVYVYLPAQILRLTGVAPWPPATGGVARWLLCAALLPAAGLGAWAVLAFAACGGTPLPFDPPRRLCSGGPYARLRNPMQCSAVATFLLAAALYRSWGLLIYALDLLLLSELVSSRHERAELRARFGAAYDDYAARAPRWLPRR